MHLRSGHSGRIQDVRNILNARAFRAESRNVEGVLNVSRYTYDQDILGALNASGYTRNKGAIGRTPYGDGPDE